jgi:hypothetical protein
MDQAEQFFEMIFGRALDDDLGRLVLWDNKSRRSQYFANAAAAAKAVRAYEGDANLYVGCGLVRPGLAENQRGTVEDITAITAMWADIDLRKESSDKPYPPTMEDAEKLLSVVGLAPSLKLMTGGGLHAWWLFSEPWPLVQGDERSKAIKMSATFNATLKAIASQHGWDVDSVGDLTRILRIPGTVNAKYGSEVTWTIPASPARYHCPDDFEVILIADEYVGERPIGQVNVDPVHFTDRPHSELAIARAAEDGKFKRTWEQRRTDMADQSANAYDLAVANEGAYLGWTDQQILEAMIAWRQKHGKSTEKLLRRRYVTRTIGLARSVHQSEVALDGLRTELPPTGALVDKDLKDKLLDKLSKILKRRVVRWLCLKGEQPTYTLILADPPQEIRIGSVEIVRSHKKFGDALYADGIMLTAKPRQWPSVCELLMRIQEVNTVTDASLESRVGEWLYRYLKAKSVTRGEQWASAMIDRQPFIKDGLVAIYARDLRKYIEGPLGYRGRVPHLYDDLRRAGMQAKTFSHEGTSVHYYTIAIDDLIGREIWPFASRSNLAN